MPKKHNTYIIGEAGCNHNGSIEKAFRLVDIAKRSKLDAIKFQVFNPDLLVTKNASKATYALRNTSKKESQYTMQKKISLTNEDYYKIKRYSDKKKIDFVCSAFDLESIDFLNKINLQTFKIPSGEINNIPYLRKIAKLNTKVILSTGMSNMDEITFAFKIFKSQFSKKKLSILHCISSYPTKDEEVNLLSIPYLKKIFNCAIGFSDHTTSKLIPALAVSNGASIIEKHFTINKKLKGPDHFMSLNEKQLSAMVCNIRIAEKSMGRYGKFISENEKKNIKHARKSIFANEFISKGSMFTDNNLIIKRPAIGISPTYYEKLIGKKAIKNFKKDEKIIC